MTTPDDDRPRRNPHRTWPQKLMLIAVCAAAFVCFAAASGLAAGQWVLSQGKLAPLADPTSQRGGAKDPRIVTPGASFEPSADGGTTGGASTVPQVIAEPDAANFLVVGADNHDCGDTPITEDRSDIGERSDTIMVWRANPKANQLAVLSFPRDLYVEFPSGSRRRINEAYRRDDPSQLQEVIHFNFGISIDHYVQIDFCAFRRLVNAVGGVEVPFDFPARDRPRNGSGPLFQIDQTGCVNLDGETALAYVRSRHYQYEDPPGSGDWYDDPTSDFGRITRQQDFIRRVLSKVVSDGLYDPDVATALITTNRDYLVRDPGLTIGKMIEFANALRNFDLGSVSTYRIESESQTTADGAAVEIPRIKGDNMKAILAVFRGEATIGSAPAQDFEDTSTDASATPQATTTTTVAADGSGDGSSGEASGDGSTATTLPEVVATENTVGIAPNRAVSCD